MSTTPNEQSAEPQEAPGVREALAELVALWDDNGYEMPICEANYDREEQGDRERERRAWAAARAALSLPEEK